MMLQKTPQSQQPFMPLRMFAFLEGGLGNLPLPPLPET
jgi:hypothetical protein